MANPTDFYDAMNNHIKAFINALGDIEVDRQKLLADPALPQQAADAANLRGAVGLTEVDFTNAAEAINQIMFTWNSGSPTQASYLYKVI